MAEKLTIANWAEEDKPREKLERLGASALSNAELLGILIGSGSTDESAVDLDETHSEGLRQQPEPARKEDHQRTDAI